jgi:ankyrin repeat protein
MSALRHNQLCFMTLVIVALGACAQACAEPFTPAASPPAEELALIIASSTGNLPAVKNLLSKGMDLDHHDFTGNTPLIYAARYARLDLVQFLLRHGADVNASTHWGTTALKEAVRKGSLPVVQILLDAGADVDQLDNRHESALFDAVKYRRLWAVDILLDRNARVDIKNDLGYTAMRYAVEQGQVQIMAELRQKSNDAKFSNSDDGTLPSETLRVRQTVSSDFAQYPQLSREGRFVPASSVIR